jgi:hypothetical protein
MAEGSKPKSSDDDDWAMLSEEEKTAYWAKMRGPSPPPRDGKKPILTRLNFFDGYFDFSKRDLGPNGCQVCQNLSVENLPPDGKVISIKFCEVKRNALSGRAVCSMIERSCRHFDILEPLIGWQEESRSQQSQYGLEYTFGDDHDTRYVYISENIST